VNIAEGEKRLRVKPQISVKSKGMNEVTYGELNDGVDNHGELGSRRVVVNRLLVGGVVDYTACEWKNPYIMIYMYLYPEFDKSLILD